MSTLGASSIHRLTLAVPFSGSWRADVILEGGALPVAGSKTTLTVGDLALVGTVERSSFDAPDRPHAVVVGGLGWERPLVKPPSYQQDAGVRLSTVLKDLAKLAGETLELPAKDVSIGSAFAAPAPRMGETIRVRDVLGALARAGYVQLWRVDPDGVTRFGPRPVKASPSTRGTVLRRNASVGVALIGVDAPAAFMPGNTAAELDGTVIRRLVVHATPDKLEAEIWGGGAQGDTAPAARTSIRHMVAEDFPAVTFGYPRTYVVTAVRPDGRLDLAPPADAPGLPVLPAVDQWSGGWQVTPNVGDLALVIFRDANPTRPAIVGLSPLRSSTPVKLKADAGAVEVGASASVVTLAGAAPVPTTPPTAAAERRAVCYGDLVIFGVPGPGTMTLAPGSTCSKVRA